MFDLNDMSEDECLTLFLENPGLLNASTVQQISNSNANSAATQQVSNSYENSPATQPTLSPADPKSKVSIPFLPCCSNVNFAKNEPFVCLCRRYFPELPTDAVAVDVARCRRVVKNVSSTIDHVIEYWSHYFEKVQQAECPVRKIGYKELATQLAERVKLLHEKCHEFQKVDDDYSTKIRQIREDENLHACLADLNQWSAEVLSTNRAILRSGVANVATFAYQWIEANRYHLDSTTLARVVKQREMFTRLSNHSATYREVSEPGSRHRYHQRCIQGAEIVELLGRVWKSGPWPDDLLTQMLPGYSKCTDWSMLAPNFEDVKRLDDRQALRIRSMATVLMGMTSSGSEAKAEESVLEHCTFLLMPIAFHPLEFD